MKIARSREEILTKLTKDTNLYYGERLALAIEEYISRLPEKKQSKARQSLPYLVQFGPVLVSRWKRLPDIRRANMGIEYWWLTEYNKDIIDEKIGEQFALKKGDLWETLPSITDVLTLLKEKWIEYPFMKKVKRGERGVGIRYIEDEGSLKHHRECLQKWTIQREESIIQEYCNANEEYCLQFYQWKGKENSKEILFGWLSFRNIPYVIGNGIHTVEELIWALSIYPHHKNNIISAIKQNEPSQLNEIPKKNQRTTIVRTASIDYGVVYETINLQEKQIVQMKEVLSALLETLPTDFIWVWRFDLKAHSLEELLSWNLRVIECNAWWWIPTIVYDEHLPIHEKYTILNNHFREMNRIALINKKDNPSLLENLIARPEILIASYTSFSKKWLKIFNSANPKAKEIRIIYKDIFKTLRKWYKQRRKRRIRSWIWIQHTN